MAKACKAFMMSYVLNCCLLSQAASLFKFAASLVLVFVIQVLSEFQEGAARA